MAIRSCRRFGRALVLSLLAGMVLASVPAQAQTVSPTAITYQGKLTKGGSEYTGTATVFVTLFDSPAGGSVIGSTIPISNVSVDQGVFTVRPDFGAAAFKGKVGYLEVKVQTPGDAGPVTLSPRQPLTAAPLALSMPRFRMDGNQATVGDGTSAGVLLLNDIPNAKWFLSTGGYVLSFWNDLGGTFTSKMSIFNSGEVCIGTDNASGMLTVQRDDNSASATGSTLCVRGGSDPTKQLLLSYQTTLDVGTIQAIHQGQQFTDLLLQAGGGNVGIGTKTPVARLDVSSTTDVLHINCGSGSFWPLKITQLGSTNTAGMRLSGAGHLRVTTQSQLASPVYAELSEAGTWGSTSDRRMKTDISPAEGSLDSALKLRPVNFRWIAGGPSGRVEFGLIAQDVRDVLPSFVQGNEESEMLTLNYSQLSVVAIGAIQELKAQNDAKLAEKQREIDELKGRLESIEAKVNGMK
ncbi:MAG: tail fiber domain-containing protein [Phycisphaerales bacterium]